MSVVENFFKIHLYFDRNVVIKFWLKKKQHLDMILESVEKDSNQLLIFFHRYWHPLLIEHSFFYFCFVLCLCSMPEFAVEQLKLDPYILRSDFQTGHLPILLSFGETAAGQMFAVDTWTLTSRVAQLLQPIKVMLVNSQGGFLDEHGKVRTKLTVSLLTRKLGLLRVAGDS